MSRTYKATGINLKSMPLGEADKLVTILTQEFGLIRAVAPGARKQNSKLAARSGLFVVNELMLAKGRSLDKITQAETLESYPGLSKDLSKLTASQYLAEVVLSHALSEQPQVELYQLLNEHLGRLEQCNTNTNSQSGLSQVLAHLSQAVFHLLALAGIAPQVQICCISQHSIQPDFTDPSWQVGFSTEAGGTVSLDINKSEFLKLRSPVLAREKAITQDSKSRETEVHTTPPPKLSSKIGALELAVLQQLAQSELPQLTKIAPNQPGDKSLSLSADTVWMKVERILRDYTQYHFGKSIRSATLVDALSIPDF